MALQRPDHMRDVEEGGDGIPYLKPLPREGPRYIETVPQGVVHLEAAAAAVVRVSPSFNPRMSRISEAVKQGQGQGQGVEGEGDQGEVSLPPPPSAPDKPTAYAWQSPDLHKDQK